MGAAVKVGVFDSGLGGLTVATEIFKQLPWVSVIYFGDTVHVPYGEKTPAQLKAYGDQICNFFMEQQVVGIVAACNTSSSVSLAYLQDKYSSIPVIGVVEPGVRLAMELTKNKKVGIIATEATVRSGAHSKVAAELDPAMQIHAQSCPKYVPLVEAGQEKSVEAEEATREYLTALMTKDIDTLILGCTHYPFLRPVIDKVSQQQLILVDPAESTVKILSKHLHEKGFHSKAADGNTNGKQVEHRFYVSGDPVSFQQVGQRLIGSDYLPKVEKKVLGV